ncbi:MAG: hypothetical protein SGJ10_14610 [Bacteroidota bacterium]|nr:hypothetical protein [Bacteroidota bacterium]
MLTITTVYGQLGYKASNAVNHKTAWSDLDTMGTAVSFSSYDDEDSSAQDIGFYFKFNDQSYNRFIINTNGFIKLDSFASSANNIYYNGGQSTSGGEFNNSNTDDSCILAIFNTDLDAGTGTPEIRVYTSSSSGSRICIIQ